MSVVTRWLPHLAYCHGPRDLSSLLLILSLDTQVIGWSRLSICSLIHCINRSIHIYCTLTTWWALEIWNKAAPYLTHRSFTLLGSTHHKSKFVQRSLPAGLKVQTKYKGNKARSSRAFWKCSGKLVLFYKIILYVTSRGENINLPP